MKKLLILLAIIWTAPAWAANFYFDSSPTGCAGAPCSNANAGTSPNTAWLSTDKFVGRTINGNDIYLFKAGDVFRYPTVDGSDLIAVGTASGFAPNARVIFGSYGTGTKPILNGSHCEGSGAATVTPPFGGAVAQASPCSGATPVTWTLDTGAIYKLAWAGAYPFNIIVDGPTGDSVFPANTTSGSGYGLSWAGCKTGTCPQSTVMVPAAWASGQAYGATACISNATQGTGEWFCRTATTGNSAGSAPVCSPGGTCLAGTTTNVTQNDTGNTWAFEGPSAFAQGAMTAGTAWWDGQFLYVWMPDGSDPSTHSIEVVTHLHGWRSNANNSEKNWQTVQGLHFTRLGEGLRFFSNGTGGTDNCMGGYQLANNIIDGIATPNADDGQFLTFVRFSQGVAASCNTQAVAHPSIFINNRMDHAGARGMTVQAAPFGLEAENEITFAPHAGVNDVSVVGQASNGLVVYHNKVHDIHHSLTYASSFPDTGVALYEESSNNLIIAENTVWDVTDPNCGSAQCDCIQTFNNTGTSILNNTCNNTVNGIYVSNGGATHIIENNLIANLATGSGASLPMNLNNTCCTTVDYDVLTNAATVGQYNSVNKTFAQWKTQGFDSNGYNANATFLNTAFPFQQTTGSVGYLTGDAAQGFGKNIGANQNGTFTR